MRSTVEDWPGYFLTIRCRSRFCPLRHVPMDRFRESWGDMRLAIFLDRLRCHLCRQPLAEATMRRPAEPGRISPGDMLLRLRGLDAGGRR